MVVPRGVVEGQLEARGFGGGPHHGVEGMNTDKINKAIDALQRICREEGVSVCIATRSRVAIDCATDDAGEEFAGYVVGAIDKMQDCGMFEEGS